MKCCYTFSVMLMLTWLWCSLFTSTCVKYRKFLGIIFYLDPKKLSSPALRLSWSIKMLKLQGRRQKANNTPAACSHGMAEASAESTVRDQLADERNVRDADSLVIATDLSEAQQHIHTADYWLHIYTPMRQCLHIHARFRTVIIILHV